MDYRQRLREIREDRDLSQEEVGRVIHKSQQGYSHIENGRAERIDYAEIIEMEIMPDHVHLLVEVDPQYGINKAVRHIKGFTSRTLRSEFPSLKSRLPTLWTNSYFVSTVGGAPLAVIKQYIENQKNV